MGSREVVLGDRDGTRRWFRDGEFHRDDGPAVERANGSREWYRDGKRHREDGPAIEWAGGREWWLNDTQYTEEEWQARRRGRMVKSARKR